MLEKDARMLSQDAQEEMRRQAIRALISGKTQTQVGEELGVQQPTVNRWWKRYEQGGWNALKKRKRGRKLGSDRKLNGEQELEIQKLIVDHTPDQLKLKFALWTREAVRQLIMEKFGVEYNLKTMSEVLRRWGFTPQRPIKKAYEQRPAEVKKWLDETYPEVEKRAKEENAEIWWGDETAVKPECHFRRGYSPKGKTPIVRQPAKRFHSSLISAINNRGKMQWMALDQALNTDIFLKFLKQLIKYRRQKIILIVDNLKVHHSYKVKQWVEKHKDRLELVYLPAYSPDLNPDEYLNNDLKQNVTKEKVPADKAELDAMVWMKMTLIELAASKIQSFFRHPQVRYAGL
jgi:transposase